jgi:hypothetical protein
VVADRAIGRRGGRAARVADARSNDAEKTPEPGVGSPKSPEREGRGARLPRRTRVHRRRRATRAFRSGGVHGVSFYARGEGGIGPAAFPSAGAGRRVATGAFGIGRAFRADIVVGFRVGARREPGQKDEARSEDRERGPKRMRDSHDVVSNAFDAEGIPEVS